MTYLVTISAHFVSLKLMSVSLRVQEQVKSSNSDNEL
jgi:hypothetical protein